MPEYSIELTNNNKLSKLVLTFNIFLLLVYGVCVSRIAFENFESKYSTFHLLNLNLQIFDFLIPFLSLLILVAELIRNNKVKLFNGINSKSKYSLANIILKNSGYIQVILGMIISTLSIISILSIAKFDNNLLGIAIGIILITSGMSIITSMKLKDQLKEKIRQ